MKTEEKFEAVKILNALENLLLVNSRNSLNLLELCEAIFEFLLKIDNEMRVRIYVSSIGDENDQFYYGYKCYNMDETFTKVFSSPSAAHSIQEKRFPISREKVPYEEIPLENNSHVKLLKTESLQEAIVNNNINEKSLEWVKKIGIGVTVSQTATFDITLFNDEICLGAISIDYGRMDKLFSLDILKHIEIAVRAVIAPKFRSLLAREITNQIVPHKKTEKYLTPKMFTSLDEFGFELGVNYPLIIGMEKKKFHAFVYNANYIGNHPCKGLFEKVNVVAKISSPILIQGESGTGKEIIARILPRLSNRPFGPFETLHIDKYHGETFDTELFGHEANAFGPTPKPKQTGVFERANGGTLFIDQIESIPISSQQKLMRVLQEDSQFKRLGGYEYIEGDFRLIAASTGRLENKKEDDVYAHNYRGNNPVIDETGNPLRVRHDLMRRINTTVLNIPPLSQRCCDIPVIFSYLVWKGMNDGSSNQKSLIVKREELIMLCSSNWDRENVGALWTIATSTIVQSLYVNNNGICQIVMPEGSISTNPLCPKNCQLCKSEVEYVKIFPLPKQWEEIIYNNKSIAEEYINNEEKYKNEKNKQILTGNALIEDIVKQTEKKIYFTNILKILNLMGSTYSAFQKNRNITQTKQMFERMTGLNVDDYFVDHRQSKEK